MRSNLDRAHGQGRRLLYHAKPVQARKESDPRSFGAWLVASAASVATIVLPFAARPRGEALAAALIASGGLAFVALRAAVAAVDPDRSMPRFDALLVTMFPAAFLLTLLSLARP